MRELIKLIDNHLPDSLIHYTVFIKSTPGELIVAFGIILVAIFINYLMKYPLIKYLKRFLYIRRKNIFYRVLFKRIVKIIRPLRLMLITLLFKKLVEIFIETKTAETIFFAIYWFLFFLFVYEIIKFLLYAILSIKIKKRLTARKELYNLSLNITRIFIVLILTILILSRIGVDLTALITSLGIGGAIIGLSAKETLTNFFDSIRLVGEDAFRQGDWIETDKVEGFVVEMGLTSTKIRTFDNALVTVPNTVLASSYIKNWTRRVVGRRIKFHLRLKYSSDMKEIDRVIYEIYSMLHSHPDIVNKNKLEYILRMKKAYENGLFNLEDKYGVRRTLLVYLDEIGEYSMNILVYAFTISVNWEEWLKIKQEIIKNIINIINESELEFALPTEEILIDRK